MYNSPQYIEILSKKFEVKYPHDLIQGTVEKIAQRINQDYAGEEILFIIILKGAVPFAVDLIKNVESESMYECISAKSYGNCMESSGDVKISSVNIDIKDKNVIIIEDIIDSGRTLSKLCEKLKEQNPKSLEIAALFAKPANYVVDVKAKYIGLEIPPDFIVGYGLDYAEKGRQYPNVYQLCE